jgi:hypothetical protein
MYMTSAKAWIAAIWGAVTGIVGSLTVVLVGNATLQTVTQAQWLAVIAAGLAGFGGGFGLTWSTTNKVAEPTEAQAAAILDKYTAPVNPATVDAPVITFQSGGQANGDIASQ